MFLNKVCPVLTQPEHDELQDFLLRLRTAVRQHYTRIDALADRTSISMFLIQSSITALLGYWGQVTASRRVELLAQVKEDPQTLLGVSRSELSHNTQENVRNLFLGWSPQGYWYCYVMANSKRIVAGRTNVPQGSVQTAKPGLRLALQDERLAYIPIWKKVPVKQPTEAKRPHVVVREEHPEYLNAMCIEPLQAELEDIARQAVGFRLSLPEFQTVYAVLTARAHGVQKVVALVNDAGLPLSMHMQHPAFVEHLPMVLERIVRAVCCLASHQLAHIDLSDGNILVSPDHVVTLIDFDHVKRYGALLDAYDMGTWVSPGGVAYLLSSWPVLMQIWRETLIATVDWDEPLLAAAQDFLRGGMQLNHCIRQVFYMQRSMDFSELRQWIMRLLPKITALWRFTAMLISLQAVLQLCEHTLELLRCVTKRQPEVLPHVNEWLLSQPSEEMQLCHVDARIDLWALHKIYTLCCQSVRETNDFNPWTLECQQQINALVCETVWCSQAILSVNLFSILCEKLELVAQQQAGLVPVSRENVTTSLDVCRSQTLRITERSLLESPVLWRERPPVTQDVPSDSQGCVGHGDIPYTGGSVS